MVEEHEKSREGIREALNETGSKTREIIIHAKAETEINVKKHRDAFVFGSITLFILMGGTIIIFLIYTWMRIFFSVFSAYYLGPGWHLLIVVLAVLAGVYILGRGVIVFVGKGRP